MAQGNSPRRPADLSPGGLSKGEDLAPPAAAAPAPLPGRIRSLQEARSALKIPGSPEPHLLQKWGAPEDFWFVAYPVSEPAAPDLLVEFAVLRVITRQGRQLVPRPKKGHLRLLDVNNALWVVYGSIVQAAGGKLVLASLAVGPAFDEQLSLEGHEDPRGVTAQLLRLVSPQRLLSMSIERLQQHGYLLEQIYRDSDRQISDKQRVVLDRLDKGHPAQTPLTDDQLADIAMRYIVLTQRGIRHPLPQLAREFGISRSQARDRVHKARQHGFLTPGTQGLAGASPGPQLKKLRWDPPSFEMTDKIKRDWTAYGQRVLLAMTPEDEARYDPLRCPVTHKGAKRATTA